MLKLVTGQCELHVFLQNTGFFFFSALSYICVNILPQTSEKVAVFTPEDFLSVAV